MKQHDATTSARSDLEAWRETVWRSRFENDPVFERLLRHHLRARYAECESQLRRVADETGPKFNDLAIESNHDENLPSLRRYDADGRRIEEVMFHPAYNAVGQDNPELTKLNEQLASKL